MRPVKGLMRPLKGLIRPFKGLIRPLKGLRPFKGLIRSLNGLIRPFKGLNSKRLQKIRASEIPMTNCFKTTFFIGISEALKDLVRPLRAL